MKVTVNKDIKTICDFYDSLNPEDKKTFMNLVDNLIDLSKGDSNENESEETGKTS